MRLVVYNVALVEAYLRTKWHLDPSSRLATIDIGRKLGAMSPFWVGQLAPQLAQCGRGRGLPPCQWFHLDPSNRLAIMHQRHIQDRQTDRTDMTTVQ